ncbi:lysophospholipid acyltransferase 7-like isoform X2 [Stegodyphus dumicola]|nr:lysophospholipid acyltransferase 7-like isoform X2 [Stegodyphus dumicola]XP_035207115.1 lysophospholipid acyltransferase 7-like isoform X2 [Stegodyphus dumicola]XP_035207116.1 lysophospholipid acyltransferase 7-like isoform X2 [Stegodyphus dumicola]XP_035207117.1 lysophospholipid acyltransferase 7-like isoform X2 [Stegodyphus dumicola]
MILDDIIYISLLCSSVALAPIIRNVPNLHNRKLFSTITGLVVVFIVSGFHIIHPLFVTFINALILLICSRRVCHIVSAIFCFVYLAFFRSTHYFGLPIPPPHTNAIQMILTLKMVGIAFEIKEEEELQAKDPNSEIQIKYRKIKPSFFDVFHYAFCIAGVLIGPYYKYRTFSDMFYLPYSSYVPANRYLIQRIQIVPFYVLLYLVGNFLYPLELASSPELLKQPFWYRVYYMTPSFFNFRMRIYAGFILGECVCIAMGLGAYPKSSNPLPGAGPTNYAALEELEKKQSWSSVEYSFETVNNIYEYGSEFWPTIREGIRAWNRTVQYWLACFVYKRLKAPKPVKMLITMMVSSFWHGVHPGYYLCLCSAPLFLFVEMEVEKAMSKHATYLQHVLFDWIWWVIKMQSFSYMGMAFLLLDIQSCLHFWKSIYFCGHIFIILIYFVAFWFNKKEKKD